ncbi:MAG: hypothetical protein HZA08_09620 [Nitrospirae bacterium]|nr:hypothetical protein [Nitrospirota bacterium]
MDKEIIRSLISGIERELENLNEHKRELKDIDSYNSIIIRRSIGSILHDFYNCCERIFKNVAIEINGGYEDSDKWHKALLYKMTMAIKDTRPAVISEELAADLDEFLSFRHVFRNIYGFGLKSERIDYLAKKFDKVVDRFIEETTKFLAFLNEELVEEA